MNVESENGARFVGLNFLSLQINFLRLEFFFMNLNLKIIIYSCWDGFNILHKHVNSIRECIDPKPKGGMYERWV